MSIDYEKIGRRIFEERKYILHISQEKMAEDLGMYQADISNLEHASKSSGIQDLRKLENIADYLDDAGDTPYMDEGLRRENQGQISG